MNRIRIFNIFCWLKCWILQMLNNWALSACAYMLLSPFADACFFHKSITVRSKWRKNANFSQNETWQTIRSNMWTKISISHNFQNCFVYYLGNLRCIRSFTPNSNKSSIFLVKKCPLSIRQLSKSNVWFCSWSDDYKFVLMP